MKNVSNIEKISQMFLIAVQNKKDIEGTIELIKKYPIGGIVLYKRLYSTYEEMINLVNKFKKANKNNKFPLFISIDQEGGRVDRFTREIEGILPAYEIGKLSSKDIFISGDITGQMLSETGINLNFAPVLDLKKFDGKHVIGNRAFSSDPKKVYKLAKNVALGSVKNNVIPTYKHLPGQGTIYMNSHFFLPVIKNYDKHLKKDMVPFIDAMTDNADAVMVGHVLIAGFDKYPTSLSKKFVTGELRNKYNFNNLIISDDYDMFSIKLFFRKKAVVKLSINAGIDIMMMDYKNYIGKLIEKSLKNNKISQDNIDKSFEKILKYKEKFKCTDNLVNGFDILDINNKIKNLNSKVNN